MKTFFAIFLGLGGALAMFAQAPALQTPEELDELYAPIALYPDALVALILPASTVPADVAQAAAYLDANGDPAGIAAQPWDESVKSLAHYPDVVKWMNENLPWTQQAGNAFLAQPTDVMKSIQQLRARAIAAGSLTNTPQQQVITDGNEIRIVPAQPNVIYVPQYDPDVVYDEQTSYAGPWLTFGAGYPEGLWLNYDLNWDNYGIWVGAWHPGWDYRHPAWRRPFGGGVAVIGHPWQAGPGRRAGRTYDNNRGRPEIVHPRTLPGASIRPPQARGPSAAPAFRPSNQSTMVRPDLRGYPPAGQVRPALTRPAPAPSGLIGGYNRGSDVRAASQRGQMSRQQSRAPAAPAGRPSAPEPRGNPGGSGGPDRRK